MSRPAASPPAIDVPPNRLIRESSPYLLQHARNPVNWYPWGDEAFKAARGVGGQDKPIFLSIGYSTCYWCHVMERECFENAAIAKIMNELFVCIKVDREQRPDVDDIYMTGVQLLTGSGGWPMSMFLDPATLKPFYGGTYFPPEDNFGRPGFPSVLQNVSEAWKTNRTAVINQANRVADAIIAQHAIDAQPVPLGQTQIDEAIAGLMSSFDKIDGGFGAGPRRAPKFPQPANLELLIGAAWNQQPVRNAVLRTLDRMAMGGMFDQVGGGFHRYSVDEKWLVPHFEKMLYDNAQLASVYARAFELTSDGFQAEVLRETLDYVLREMTSTDGAFFSAQDAEVNALEGGNYLWTADEFRASLSATDAEFAMNVYGVDRGPNFEDPHHPEAGRSNVLFLPQRPYKLAQAMSMPHAEFDSRLQRINQALLAVRMQRDQPATDDKILAGWNGLMIAGFAIGGRVLKVARYVEAATTAAECVLSRMRSDDGDLLRSSRNGVPQIDAFLEDYAFMIRGLLALHRATNEPHWLDEAVKLTDAAKDRFWDKFGGGGFFDTREGQSDLFVRIKSVNDGAVPSGNSFMLLNLLDLHERTNDARWLADAQAQMTALSSAIAAHPAGSVLAILALDRMKGPQTSVAASAPTAKAGRVAVAAQPSEVTVKPGWPAQFEVTLEIAKGWHVNSHAPGDDSVVPLKLELTGCEGLKITPRYPAGESFSAGDGAKLQVYSGRIAIPVTVQLTENVTGLPQLWLTCQACNDMVCLEPKRLLIELRILAQT